MVTYRPTLLFLVAVMAAVLSACGDGPTGDSLTTTSTSGAVEGTADSPSTTASPASTSSTGDDDVTTSADDSATSTTGVGGTGGTIGVVGCSNTDQAVTGYVQVSSSPQLVDGGLGGGTVSAWGDPADRRYQEYWGLYDQRRPADGYDGTWVQLCMRLGEHDGTFTETHQAWVSHIVEEIHRRDPGIPVWISPLNFYEGIVCDAVGAAGPAVAAETADWAAANIDGVDRGPDLGPLLPEHMGVRDNCHPNKDGELLLGEQLATFFD